jgi:hypothetical protein
MAGRDSYKNSGYSDPYVTEADRLGTRRRDPYGTAQLPSQLQYYKADARTGKRETLPMTILESQYDILPYGGQKKPDNNPNLNPTDFKWAGDPKKQREAAQRYARQTLIERGHNPLMHRIRSETGYDFSDPLKTQGKISLGPEALQDNNYVAEHEFMHRGQQEADIERGELTPYAYQAVKGIGLHPYSAGEMSFKSKYGRDPTSGDKARLEQDLAAAKEEYERRYTSGPSGGMPYEFQPNLGDTPPSSIMDGGAIIIDDGNPAKRRKLI